MINVEEEQRGSCQWLSQPRIDTREEDSLNALLWEWLHLGRMGYCRSGRSVARNGKVGASLQICQEKDLSSSRVGIGAPLAGKN